MRLKIVLPFVLFGTLFASCKKERSLQEQMTNSWETTYLKIDMPTYLKSDSTNVYEDKFLNNPERRAQSSYNNDGTFSAWFVDRNDKRLGEESIGKWSIEGDSLLIEYFYGGREVKVGYHIQITEEGFVGTSKYDWDEDGEFDDMLVMKTKKLDQE
ncbi:MAG: hypothetical protein JXR05_01655 [Flavobacteriaceae bacterium]